MRIVFVLCILSSIVHSQSTIYYPLEKGNQWDFHVTSGSIPIWEPYFSIVETGDTLMPNGLIYAVKMKDNYTGKLSMYSFERFSNDSVYAYSNDKDSLIWYFFKKDTVLKYSNNYSVYYTIDTLGFKGHLFKRWRRLSASGFAGGGINLGMYYTDSLGYTGNFNANVEYDYSIDLTAAIINGVRYGEPHGTVLGVIGSESKGISSFRLDQNYPNPFNPATTISYSLPKRVMVRLMVYDLLGRIVKTLVDEEQSKGDYKVKLDGSMLPSGLYIYTIHAGEFQDSKKLVLIK